MNFVAHQDDDLPPPHPRRGHPASRAILQDSDWHQLCTGGWCSATRRAQRLRSRLPAGATSALMIRCFIFP
jgi:hypothetical protein